MANLFLCCGKDLVQLFLCCGKELEQRLLWRHYWRLRPLLWLLRQLWQLRVLWLLWQLLVRPLLWLLWQLRQPPAAVRPLLVRPLLQHGPLGKIIPDPRPPQRGSFFKRKFYHEPACLFILILLPRHLPRRPHILLVRPLLWLLQLLWLLCQLWLLWLLWQLRVLWLLWLLSRLWQLWLV